MQPQPEDEFNFLKKSGCSNLRKPGRKFISTNIAPLLGAMILISSIVSLVSGPASKVEATSMKMQHHVQESMELIKFTNRIIFGPQFVNTTEVSSSTSSEKDKRNIYGYSEEVWNKIKKLNAQYGKSAHHKWTAGEAISNATLIAQPMKTYEFVVRYIIKEANIPDSSQHRQLTLTYELQEINGEIVVKNIDEQI